MTGQSSLLNLVAAEQELRQKSTRLAALEAALGTATGDTVTMERDYHIAMENTALVMEALPSPPLPSGIQRGRVHAMTAHDMP